MVTKPNFLHIGSGKAASTWLWRVCKEHPDIHVPETPDNVNFFTVHYQRGLEWYVKTYFSAYDGEKAIGEFSNSYIVYPPAMERIARDLPDVRLTMTLRNPIEVAFLGWAHLHLKKKPTGLDMERGIGIPFEKMLHHHGHGWFRLLLDPGFHARHLKRIFSLIPRERAFIGIYDDLAADNADYVRRYFEFLGVDPGFRPVLLGTQVNPDSDSAAWDRWVKPDVRAELGLMFKEEMEELGEMLGRDLSHWR